MRSFGLMSVVMLGVLALVVQPVVGAEIDFEGLPPGTIVIEISSGSGVSGPLSGKIKVFGSNPAISGGLINAAVIFPSDAPTGGDTDLGTENETFGGPGIGPGGEMGSPNENDTAHFNILIIDESLEDGNGDSLVDDPDDADELGMFIDFDFSSTKNNGKGTVTVNSFTYLDIEVEEGEGGANVFLSGPSIPVSMIALPPTGDNGVNEIPDIGVSGVSLMRVQLNGSGAMISAVIQQDDIRPCWITTGGFQNAGIQAGSKDFTFGGNVGPPPSGAWEVVDHNTGDNFHTNNVQIVDCLTIGTTGPQQPGGKKGFNIDKALFEGTGRLRKADGTVLVDLPFTGFVIDAGEPQGRRGNDKDYFEIIVMNPAMTMVLFEASGELDGGNVQIHPPNPSL